MVVILAVTMCDERGSAGNLSFPVCHSVLSALQIYFMLNVYRLILCLSAVQLLVTWNVPEHQTANDSRTVTLFIRNT